jgi:catechol 2,3-dioxygenase-like lactoylglutathione lyase family enzyme
MAGLFDHVMIRVSDRDASEAFYDTALATLGIDSTYRTNAISVWHDFQLTRTDAEHLVTRGLHVAFVAPTRAQVEDFRRAGPTAEDGDTDRAILRDPDGNTVEAVHRDTMPSRRGGRIDDLRLGVGDLAASAAFYRTIAPAAGLRLRAESADRATFAADGATLTLAADVPRTANLHLAFPGDDDAVRRFHADATAAGHPSNGEPGERARYHPGYYAAYVLDPDGNNIEVVSHNLG